MKSLLILPELPDITAATAPMPEDFAEFDLILAMDEQNVWNLEQKRPYGDPRYQKAVVRKILEYAPEYGENVPDPYYHNGFDYVFEMIEAACRRLLDNIIRP